MAKILITGGAGFIGFHLVKKLAERGDEVVIAENFARGRKDLDFDSLLSRKNVKLITIDLTEKTEYEKLGKGYNYIYHLAAINGTKYFYEIPDKVIRANTLPLFHLLEWFLTQGKGKILFTSSSEVYAGALSAFGKLPIPTPENVPLVVEDTSNVRWSYGVGKIVGEVLLNIYGKKHSIPFSIVRYHNIYGPRMGYEHVIPQFIGRVIEKKDPFPIYGGEETRTFCYVDDAVDATIQIMESDKTNGETFHIGQDPKNEIKIIDVLGKIFKIAGWHPKKIDINPAPEGSVKRRAADISKIKKIVGHQPKVSLDEGLRKTFEWYGKIN